MDLSPATGWVNFEVRTTSVFTVTLEPKGGKK